jgi:hypothetical protein
LIFSYFFSFSHTKESFLKIFKKFVFLKIVVLSGVLLGSCAGVRADINVKADGSGTMTLEYRFSQTLENWGKLDGNEGFPAIPVGETDFRRSVPRVDGLKLRSFSSKKSSGTGESPKDNVIINTAKLEFAHTQALLGFLDAGGGKAVLVREQGKNRLSLTLMEKNGGVDPDLLALFAALAEGFDFVFTMTLPSENAEISVFTSDRSPLALGNVSRNRSTVSFSAPVSDLLSAKEGVILEIVWQ